MHEGARIPITRSYDDVSFATFMYTKITLQIAITAYVMYGMPKLDEGALDVPSPGLVSGSRVENGSLTPIS
jgi:hypothetical protein